MCDTHSIFELLNTDRFSVNHIGLCNTIHYRKISHKSLLRESGSGLHVRMLQEFCEVPEISGVILLSTGDQDQRLLHSKINESLIDDLDADGRVLVNSQRHTGVCTWKHAYRAYKHTNKNMLTILLEINHVCTKNNIFLLSVVQYDIFYLISVHNQDEQIVFKGSSHQKNKCW